MGYMIFSNMVASHSTSQKTWSNVRFCEGGENKKVTKSHTTGKVQEMLGFCRNYVCCAFPSGKRAFPAEKSSLSNPNMCVRVPRFHAVCGFQIVVLLGKHARTARTLITKP